jgi:hypothetical protein
LPLTRYRYEIRSPGNIASSWEQTSVDVGGNEILITGRRNLSDLDFRSHPVHRLWLQSGAELVTNGSDLHLELIELRADGATIMTFPTGAQAPVGTKGRDGGPIRITAERASETSLTLVARGERGGPGSTGAKGVDGANGSAGANAKGIFLTPNFGPKCVQMPANGAAGANGAVGAQGKIGSPGGNSGHIEITVVEPSGTVIEANVEPGTGGEGGPGG